MVGTGSPLIGRKNGSRRISRRPFLKSRDWQIGVYQSFKPQLLVSWVERRYNYYKYNAVIRLENRNDELNNITLLEGTQNAI